MYVHYIEVSHIIRNPWFFVLSNSRFLGRRSCGTLSTYSKIAVNFASTSSTMASGTVSSFLPLRGADIERSRLVASDNACCLGPGQRNGKKDPGERSWGEDPGDPVEILGTARMFTGFSEMRKQERGNRVFGPLANSRRACKASIRTTDDVSIVAGETGNMRAVPIDPTPGRASHPMG